MLDSLELEDRGVVTALVATEKLAKTTARGMARAQGVPDMDIAMIPHLGLMTDVSEDFPIDLEALADQVEKILTTDG